MRKRRGPGVQPIVEYWRLRFFVHVFVNKVFVKACRIRRVIENVFGFFSNYRREGEKDSLEEKGLLSLHRKRGFIISVSRWSFKICCYYEWNSLHNAIRKEKREEIPSKEKEKGTIRSNLLPLTNHALPFSSSSPPFFFLIKFHRLPRRSAFMQICCRTRWISKRQPTILDPWPSYKFK